MRELAIDHQNQHQCDVSCLVVSNCAMGWNWFWRRIATFQTPKSRISFGMLWVNQHLFCFVHYRLGKECDSRLKFQAHKFTNNGYNVTKASDDRKFPNIYVKEHVMQILKNFHFGCLTWTGYFPYDKNILWKRLGMKIRFVHLRKYFNPLWVSVRAKNVLAYDTEKRCHYCLA